MDKTAQQLIDDLIAQVEEAETVEQSAIEFINGVPAMIKAAVDEALANGATAEQLAPLQGVIDALKAKDEALKAALTANTPAE